MEDFIYQNQEEDTLISAYSDSATDVAKDIFNVPSLYPWQRLVIANIIESAEYYLNETQEENKENSDIINKGKQIVLLPTGAGKSMCFMVPSVLLPRPTLIIYPLLALMSDQLRRIEQAGLDAVIFRGQQTVEERNENFQKIKNGTKIILANPEVLQSEELRKKLAACNIIHAAIDEAHCVSEWGDSFRPAYLLLGNILQELKIPVITAFTATASPSVLSRITEILFSNETPYLMKSTSDRQNIHYSVKYTNTKQKTALYLATKEKKPLIIFCGTRNMAEDTAKLFREIFPSENIRFYHAGLSKEEKTKIEKWFFPHKNAILCTTCAFGMGIDKSDIRTVIHLEPSPTAEAYVQEAGRGGRDGKDTKAILLWSLKDSEKAHKKDKNSRERILSNFAETDKCRRQILLDALGGEEVVCSGCDNCDNKEKGKSTSTMPQDALRLYNFIKLHNGQYSKFLDI